MPMPTNKMAMSSGTISIRTDFTNSSSRTRLRICIRSRSRSAKAFVIAADHAGKLLDMVAAVLLSKHVPAGEEPVSCCSVTVRTLVLWE